MTPTPPQEKREMLLTLHKLSKILVNPRNPWYNISEVISVEYTVKTNIGEMPIEDYRDIKARQLGFDDYDDMYSQGYRLGDPYDIGSDAE